MMKSRFRVVVLSLIVLTSIVGGAFLYLKAESEKLVIEGVIVASDDMSTVYLKSYNSDKARVIDSVSLSDKGAFRFVVDKAPKELAIYELVCGWESIPLICRAGDSVDVGVAGSISLNYTVSGSEESELLRLFFQPYIKGSRELKQLSRQYAQAESDGGDPNAIAKEYSDKYKEIKQSQLRYVVENKGSLASLYAFWQRLPGDQYLFEANSDLIYMKLLAESLAETNPESPYLSSLNSGIEELSRSIALFQTMEYTDYPEVKMNDMFGKQQSLSSLKGKVILLDFWLPGLAASNQHNALLKEIYKDQKTAGVPFEVYQVGVTTNKAGWVDAVQSQRLPWISVSDLAGDRSVALRSYNITQLPANILIDSEGVVVARDLYGEELRKKLSEL